MVSDLADGLVSSGLSNILVLHYDCLIRILFSFLFFSNILSPRPILVLHFLIVRHKAIPKIIISREIFDTVSWVQCKLTASRFVVW